jgi:hypothetical protein
MWYYRKSACLVLKACLLPGHIAVLQTTGFGFKANAPPPRYKKKGGVLLTTCAACTRERKAMAEPLVSSLYIAPRPARPGTPKGRTIKA